MVFLFECAACDEWSRTIDHDDLQLFINAKDEFNRHEREAHPEGAMGKISPVV